MIREATREIRIGELFPVYLDITWTLSIDTDLTVIPLKCEVWTNNGPGPKEVRTDVNAAQWWDFLTAKEQDEIIKEIIEEEKDPADEWDFNDNGNPKMFRRWRGKGNY